MFHFPFGTMHELNLDWFLGEWENYKQEWADAQAGIDNALQGEIDRVEDAMTDLYDARDTAVQAKDDAETAAASVVSDAAQCGVDALKAEGFAVGEQDGIPVGSGSPYYQQNAKYYKVEAGTYRYLSEAYAKGEMGGSPVAPGEAGYQDNAKYYKDAADLDASTASSAAASADADALLTEGYSVGEQNGTPVSSGSPYYQNNAKYFYQQTAQDKADTDTLKDAANAAALRAEGYSSGTQNGTPVSSDSPYYENNAAYFYGQAAGTSGALAQAMIAEEEATAVATRAYEQGEYIRIAGILYRVKTHIDIGDTLSTSTNIAADVLSDGVYKLKNNFVNDISSLLYQKIFKYKDATYGPTAARTIEVHDYNRITYKATGTSSTFKLFILTGNNPRIFTGNFTDFTSNMTLDDFKDCPIDLIANSVFETYIYHPVSAPGGSSRTPILAFVNITGSTVTYVGSTFPSNESGYHYTIPVIPATATHFAVIYYTGSQTASANNTEAIFNFVPNSNI